MKRAARSEKSEDVEKTSASSKGDDAGKYDAKYYTGMLSSPLSAEDRDMQIAESRDGLAQNLKFVGGMALIISALFLGFMASNGLI